MAVGDEFDSFQDFRDKLTEVTNNIVIILYTCLVLLLILLHVVCMHGLQQR